jgi:hypothetical protein
MMRLQYRKTAPRVKRGKVQRKNRWSLTPNCYTDRPQPIVDRHKPGFGYRHILCKADIGRFIRLLPDWAELSKGLNSVVLAAGSSDRDGWYSPGVVAVCAWERDLWREVFGSWYMDHRGVLDQIGVLCERTDDGYIRCDWTESTIRAYQLTHVLLHELGHHHDRMTTRSKRQSSRGEGYAERYAIRYANLIWERFLDEFGLP